MSTNSFQSSVVNVELVAGQLEVNPVISLVLQCALEYIFTYPIPLPYEDISTPTYQDGQPKYMLFVYVASEIDIS